MTVTPGWVTLTQMLPSRREVTTLKKKIWATGGLLATGLLATVLIAGPLLLVHGDATPTTTELAAPTTVKTGTQTAKATDVSGTTSNAKVTYQQNGQTTPAATYQTNTKTSATQAAKQVSNQDHRGEAVKLSDGTKATEQGVMGHIYVSWTKGNWSVTAVTDTTQTLHTDPTTLASTVNKSLKQNDITTQDVDKGAVTVYSSAQDTTANQITWQNNKQVANVKAQQAATGYQIAKSVISKTK